LLFDYGKKVLLTLGTEEHSTEIAEEKNSGIRLTLYVEITLSQSTLLSLPQ
jgi:hypothetical protein